MVPKDAIVLIAGPVIRVDLLAESPRNMLRVPVKAQSAAPITHGLRSPPAQGEGHTRRVMFNSINFADPRLADPRQTFGLVDAHGGREAVAEGVVREPQSENAEESAVAVGAEVGFVHDLTLSEAGKNTRLFFKHKSLIARYLRQTPFA